MLPKDLITVPGVAKSMGVKMTQAQATKVGNTVMNAYRRKNEGALPPKDLNGKTNGGGSHCHAHYPPDWYDLIRDVIRRVGAENDAQGRLF